jgi:hypothetical protein
VKTSNDSAPLKEILHFLRFQVKEPRQIRINQPSYWR